MIDNVSLYRVLYTSTVIGRRTYEMGKRIDGYELNDVYRNPSFYKRRAYDNCYREFLEDEDARMFRIASHNCQYFTVAWETSCIDPKTGAREPCTLIDTGRNRYVVIDA